MLQTQLFWPFLKNPVLILINHQISCIESGNIFITPICFESVNHSVEELFAGAVIVVSNVLSR